MTTHRAKITIDGAFRVGPVPRRLFGSFVEHMGRSVYGGIYEPEHPDADANGFRQDVLDLTRELGVTTVRYPGGNFVSGYDWRDGIGPRADRPTRLDRAWKSIETNEVGTDDFMRWAASAGVAPMMAVNLGTGTVQDACDLVEYCNYPSGTKWSDLRIQNGAQQPHDVRTWCLGNEMDGPWQIGHKTADEYGRIAAETARALRRLDPTLELIACGSSNSTMPSFGGWEATVLSHTHDLIDLISLHAYYEEKDGDAASFLSSAVDMDDMIRGVIATADSVAARLRSSKRVNLSFDEWNVWYQSRFPGEDALDYANGRPLIEDNYSLIDAVVVGDLMGTLLRHSDRVSIACQAQLVNVIAPIRTERGGRAWKQATFEPFALSARYARGDVLLTAVDSDRQQTKRYGDVSILSATATHDPDSNEVVLFLVNRSPEHGIHLTARLHDVPSAKILQHAELAGPDIRVINTPAQEAVKIRDVNTLSLLDGTLEGDLPACSWTMVRLSN